MAGAGRVDGRGGALMGGARLGRRRALRGVVWAWAVRRGVAWRTVGGRGGALMGDAGRGVGGRCGVMVAVGERGVALRGVEGRGVAVGGRSGVAWPLLSLGGQGATLRSLRGGGERGGVGIEEIDLKSKEKKKRKKEHTGLRNWGQGLGQGHHMWPRAVPTSIW
jgi:hypothetical protein